jgi:hypothetical protein
MKPICLLQWLPQNEHRETADALSSFADQIDISHFDVRTADEARAAVRGWLGNNPNSQFLFIGAHGITGENNQSIGLGSSGLDFATWHELWEWLGIALCTPVIWLGACKSSDAAKAWSPFPSWPKRVSWIAGFRTGIYPIEIKRILLHLMTTISINPIIYVDNQLEYLRSKLPNTAIELFFPAYTLDRQYEYVNVDEFEMKVGVPFQDFLRQQP